MTEAPVSAQRRLLAWRVGLGIVSFAAATGFGLAILLAVHGFWPGVGIFAAVASFEVWRAVTLYRKKPAGVTVDLAVDLAQRNARMRVSAWVVTVCAIGCAILAAIAGRVELWLIGGLLSAGAALAWFATLWLIPRARRRSAGS